MHLPDNTLLHSGKYRIVRFISKGGFGCTYEGVHTMLRTRVCIKEFFVPDYCTRDQQTHAMSIVSQGRRETIEQLKAMFVKEARALFTMKHPNIVRVVDIFRENGTSYYVMDYIDGESLQSIITKNGPLTEDEALRYIREVCSALQYVHGQHRLHLDIKPANIMVNDKGKAILIDFGASKHYDEQTDEETSGLTGIVTSGYAPAEQASHAFRHFCPATDIYAVGATLYKLLTGITPPSSVQLAADEEVMIEMPAEISDNTRRAVRYAMDPVRTERPQSIPEFLQLLDGEILRPAPVAVSAEQEENNIEPWYESPVDIRSEQLQRPVEQEASPEAEYEPYVNENPEKTYEYKVEHKSSSLSPVWWVILIVSIGIALGAGGVLWYRYMNKQQKSERVDDQIEMEVESVPEADSPTQ